MKKNIQTLSIYTYPAKPIFLLALIWLLFFYLMFMHTSAVAAHSEFVKSEPKDGQVLNESPTQVTVWFSQEMDGGFSALRVFDSQNNQVDNGDGGVDLNDLDHLTMVVSLPPLHAGTYSIHWVTVSAEDGDEEEGDFTFIVSGGDPVDESPSAPAASGSFTWLFGGGIILLVFILLVWFFVFRRMASG